MKKIIEVTIYPKISRIPFSLQGLNYCNSSTERENWMKSRLTLTSSLRNTKEITTRRRRKLRKTKRLELKRKESITKDKCSDSVT
jgi:hypothetical protein